MGKITRKPQEKHKLSLSPAVSEIVTKISTFPVADLPALFSSWSQRWPYPRGDLNNWIEPLDRFDAILQSFITKYGLDTGPQTESFGVSLLLEGSPGYDENKLKELGFGAEGDRELVESVLVFSRLLVEKCANRAVYSSTDRLNDLLNTTSLSLLHGTLRLTIFLAQRYSERTMTSPHQIIKFYDYDHDRLQRLASPVAQYLPALRRVPTSPVKTTKGKEKMSQTTRPRRGSSTVNPNDFRALCRDTTQQSSTGKASSATIEREWQSWAHVKVTWLPSNMDQKDVQGPSSQGMLSDPPSTPTPVRSHPSSGLSRVTADIQSSPLASAITDTVGEGAGLKRLDLTQSELADTSIEQVLRQRPEDMPPDAQYELLHKLRIAYGLMSSSKSRRELLAIRLLAITSVGNVFGEEELTQKLFGTDEATSKAQELVQQLVSLIQDGKKGQGPVSLYLQTLAMEVMGVLARHKLFASDINTVLGASSSHGLLLRLTQKGLIDIARDNDHTDTPVGDDWREAVFSMPRVVIEATGHHGRSSENIIASTFLTTYISGFSITTGKALRVHLRMLDFIKTFFHHFKDGLPTLLGTNTFESATALLDNLSKSAWEQLQAGSGIPSQFKTRATDYEIPYMHQQIIRSIIDMVNDISGHQGAHADRVLRSLIDSQTLLSSFHLIIDHLQAFGIHTWSEIVKALCGFLHNEPTCYTVIAEAGIIASLLNTVVSSKEPDTPSETQSSEPKTISSSSQQLCPGIPPSADAIINVSQAFGAICLTSAGFDTFKASGALEKFFELFESPAHVMALKDGNTLALLGSTFDELARHHPNLRPSVLSAVTVMLARVLHIGRKLSAEYGAGPKLWLNTDEEKLSISGGSEALKTEIVPASRTDNNGGHPSRRTLNLPNGDTLDLDFNAASPEPSLTSPVDYDSFGLNVTQYARPAISFLMNFFENQSLCTSFLELGGADIVLDFVTISSIPANEQAFRHGGFFPELASVVHMMAETKPNLVLPFLADRARFACSQLKHFNQYQPRDLSCYFGPMLQHLPKGSHLEVTTSPNARVPEQGGTGTVRSLMAVYCLSQVLSEVFNMAIYSTRSSQNYLFGQVNLADIFAELCRMLGGVSAACLREEIILQRVIPEAWLTPTRLGDFGAGDEEVDKLLSVFENPQVQGASTAAGENATNANANQSSRSIDRAEQTAIFKNVSTLRYLLSEIPASIAEFLSRLGRGLAGKRRIETFSKQKAALVANALATSYLTQLQPSFWAPLDQSRSSARELEVRFLYLGAALTNIRNSFYDDSPSAGPSASRQTFVIDAFRKAGGVKCLTQIGKDFFEQLKSCKLEHAILSANTGLKICLEILNDLTSAKNIVESAQSSMLRNNDPSRPFYFVPSQVLLDLRMEALPLTRLIWEDTYADQASKDVVQKLVSILKHVLTGDSESEAIQHPSNIPTISPFTPRKFQIDPQKVNSLKEKGYAEDIAREALYRCNTNHGSGLPAAEEYCKALAANPRRQRLGIPSDESDVTSTSRETPIRASPLPTIGSAATNLFGEPPLGPIEAALAEVVNSVSEDNEMEDMTNTLAQESPHSQEVHPTATSATMDISSILNDSDEPMAERPSITPVTPTYYTVDSINMEREDIRKALVERCNNVLNHHQNLTFELSDLIMSATKKLSDDEAKRYWEDTSDLLVNSLLSMQTDEEITEQRGQRIAAAAHLTALLIQDHEVFKKTLPVFQDSFDGLLTFLQLPPNVKANSEEPYPWVAPVILIIERMLSRDAEPVEIRWEPPSDLDSSSIPEITGVSVFDNEQKRHLFDLLVNLLPRVGKDKSMALSLSRVLVILTRKREIASLLSERRNLQRLFLMVKQLSTGLGGRLQSAFMLILRHIVEDEATLKQIMRSEITACFTGRNASRQIDLTNYTRELYHLVLRSPETFVETSEEMVKLSSWQPHSASTGLTLKETPEEKEGNTKAADNTQAEIAANEDPTSKPAASVEGVQDEQHDLTRSKTSELKPPVVEHPDGVVHFILSELLAYKDVEDKDVPPLPRVEPSISDSSGSQSSNNIDASTPGDGRTESPQTKSDKPKFKPEDHPIFIYRCFLLQSLSELLHSYNRTKIEFINFSRKADPLAITPSKPRSGILNYLLQALVPSGYVEKEEASMACKKKLATSDWAIRVIVALCSKTGEMGLSGLPQRYSTQPVVDDQDDEPDLSFVRRFVLEHAIKTFKEATNSTEALQTKYSRILCLSDMFNRLLTKPSTPDGSAGSLNNSYKVLGRMMFEKNLISVLTSSLSEIDLAYQGSKRVIKFILRPLGELTNIATQLSLSSPDLVSSLVGNVPDDVISSASSVSEEVDNDREETPDLFRHSALGLLDPNRTHESDSESGEEEDEDEEMFDEEYEDEMEYDEGMPAGPNDDEAVSDDEGEEMNIEGPIEGIPGDVPMDIEFVVNDPHMEVDTEDEDDEDDEDESDDDDEDDDEDGEDFIIEADDVVEDMIEGQEDGSLDDVEGGEEDWEDEEGEDDDEDESHDHDDQDDDPELSFDGEAMPIIAETEDPTHADLNNLLRVLGERDIDSPLDIEANLPSDLIGPPIVTEEHGDEDEDEDEDDEDGEEMDENDELGYDNFDRFLDGGEEMLDQNESWDWDEPPPFIRRHRHIRNGPHISSFLGRRFGHEAEFQPMMARSGRRMPLSRAGGDDGINPLLQRPVREDARPPRPERMLHHIVIPHGADGGSSLTAFPPITSGPTFAHIIQGDSEMGGHGAMLDAILQALHRGERDFLRNGRLQFNMTAPLSEIREILRPSGQNTAHRHHNREEAHRSLSFTPALTITRWQEEARLLFGNLYLEKIQRVQVLLMSILISPAQLEEKDRRQKREEVRIEMERRAAEAEAERLKKEEEEREAAAKAEAEARARAEAEAAAAASEAAANQEQDTSEISTGGTIEPMEDIQNSSTAASGGRSGEAETVEEAIPRVYTTIRGRQLDITGLDIDLEYLEALPEEFREEVIMQQYATRREEAQQESGNADASGIDPEFLNALPDDIREEIRAQEAHAARRREREAARRQAATAAGHTQAEEMDSDNFLATLDPALRRAILAEQPAEILQQLDPRHAAEGRAHQRRLFPYAGMPGDRDGNDGRPQRDQAQRDNKRQVIQLIDKAGVATLLRLMFLPQQGSLKTNLWHILRNVCGNRQTRFEVINMLLVILKEGSTDVNAVERSLASLSLRAKATGTQRTPQPLKRTLSIQPNAGLSEEVTPLMVIQQCLSALKQLSQHGFHVRTIFLREIDVGSSSKNRKGKGRDHKSTKYPINDLIGLLDRKLIMDSSTCLQSLAELLAAVTSPLILLMRKEKSKPDAAEAKIDEQTTIQENVDQDPTSTTETRADSAMVEATVTGTDDSTTGIETSVDAQGDDEKTPKIVPMSTDEDMNLDDSKQKKSFDPPLISEYNLQLIVNIFVAQECNSDTFHSTLETLSHLSFIPEASTTFSKELISHVNVLSQSISNDLDELLPHIRDALSSTDLHGISSAKFSHSGSDQVKLLRVLQALDYLSAPKKDNENEDAVAAKSILTTSYDSLSLGPLWNKLSGALTVIREKDNIIGFANILLPLIESLMVVCKNTSLKDSALTRQVREQSQQDSEAEKLNELEELFFNFTTEHRKILNDIIRQSPKLMQGNGSFSLLVKNPKVLDFDNKRAYFTKQIHSRLHQQRHVQPPLQLNVRRDQVFLDSYKALYFKTADEMKYGKLNIRFNGEEGVDAGGVTREWFQVLARGMFNPDWALWQPVAADRTTFHPNPLSWINGEHLLYFKFIGRIIGKALHEGRVLDCHFSRAVYKRLLGKQPNLKDLESMDLDYYKSLVWILENNIEDIITEDFSVIEEQFGEEKVVDLIPDGRNIPVTEENKKEYVQKLVEYRLTTSVKDQLDNFIRGFHDIIPAELVAIFDEQELELLISGLPEIDVDDWKANTEYHNYNSGSPQVTWFWRIVRAMSNEERAKLLQFITGTSKVPLNGFKDLEGMQGTTRFSIHRDPSQNRLPTSHTCFNQLDLPAYDSFEVLKSNLMTAINLGADYFGFA